ncbi:multicopper oxidase family protein [Dictyobacter formicarum]|uniref:Oxidase (Copper-binding protein) n=1 Tax=Dictyobacter formicarum TaxID=2778368 RepID=A0ABQ3VE55_9CHLR|nr:multicopper oxidase family protein [Dictyobacter formicarum]GHO84075.1 putative oxidase (copper-binding protein) [Dictyobacter formicarum]
MNNVMQQTGVTRRQFLKYVGVGSGMVTGMIALDACGTLPAKKEVKQTFANDSGTGKFHVYTFNPAPTQLTVGGHVVSTWAYNGRLPGPEIRVNAGDTLRVIVNNHVSEGTTIHWHGVPIVNAMDGVDGVTQPAIKPGHSFTYEFVVSRAGTYFYHSHVGLQLDRGLYGPLIVEDPQEAKNYDQDVVLVLDDWLDGIPGGPGSPSAALKQLIAGGDTMPGMNGIDGLNEINGMGDSMIIQVPPDLLYPLYLINGKASEHPFTINVQKGHRIRLRFINASAATIYHLALNGHRMTVTHTDGQPVEPVDVDAIRIGMGERYDVLVTANNPGVWQLAAQVEGAKNMTRALLRYQGSTATQPPADFLPPELKRHMLTYAMLKAASGNDTPLRGQPDQSLPIQLSGGMGQYVWKINDQVFSKADKIAVRKDRLIQFQINNQSIMPHPMHLHGHFFQIDNGTGRGPIKDTVLLDPIQTINITWVSDNPGDWAFHCHNVYHQAAGMMRVVKIR